MWWVVVGVWVIGVVVLAVVVEEAAGGVARQESPHQMVVRGGSGAG